MIATISIDFITHSFNLLLMNSQKFLKIPGFSSCILFSALFPAFTFASVYISEVAWMGGTESANDEWIELHNQSDAAVDLSGWTLTASDGSPSISLSGTISAQSFVLLERTNDGTVPGVSGDIFYSGALSNSGETLVLKDGGGAIVDQVSKSDGWLAGDNNTKETMQKSGSNWITAFPTPKSENVTDGTIGVNTEPTASTGGSSHTGSSDISTVNSIAKKNLTLYAGRDRVVTVGQDVHFTGELVDSKNNIIVNDSYRWNFGDGLSKSGRKVAHEYLFPGTYIVVLTAKHEGEIYTARLTVEVRDFSIEIVEIGNGYVALENTNDFEINIGDWIIKEGEREYYIPKETIILPQSTLRPRHPFESIDIVLIQKGEAERASISVTDLMNTQEELQKISTDLVEMSQTISQMSPSYTESLVAAVQSGPLPEEAQKELEVTSDEGVSSATTVILYTGEEKLSLFGKIKNFFASLF